MTGVADAEREFETSLKLVTEACDIDDMFVQFSSPHHLSVLEAGLDHHLGRPGVPDGGQHQRAAGVVKVQKGAGAGREVHTAQAATRPCGHWGDRSAFSGVVPPSSMPPFSVVSSISL